MDRAAGEADLRAGAGRDDATGGLLWTKLAAPPPRADLVARPRLTRRLDEAAGRKLTLLSAPPGSGKTTLVGAWLARQRRPVAWLALDEDDNDPARFWTYAIAALERAYPGATGPAPALLRAPRPPAARAILTTLLNALPAAEGAVYLVLDDYHLIAARDIHDALDYFLARLPPHVRLVLTSRTDPPLALARLRARGELAELRAADLRFTPDEAAGFLGGAMGLRLAPEHVALLEERTEGWIAGLQLAALSLRGRDDPGAFIAGFAGDHRYVADYLADEVIDRQPERIRAFLPRIAILDRMCGPLCDALTGGTEGAILLAELERANLFLVALDDERRWYRYHALFAGALRERLRRTFPEEIPELHRRASAWFEREGMTEPAVRHALAAGETERAATLVGRVAEAYWKRGDIARPELCLFHSWVRLVAGRFAEGLRRLDEAEGALRARPDAPALHGALCAIRATLARADGDHAGSSALARRTLALAPEGETTWRAIAALNLGQNAHATGDLAGARRAFAETLRLSERGGDLFGAVTAMLGAAGVEEDMGHLHTAAELAVRGLETYGPAGAPLPPIAGYFVIGLATLAYEWNRLDEAERLAGECLELGRTGELFDLLYNGSITLARIRKARGDHPGALRAVGEALRPAAYGRLPSLAAAAAAWRTHILFAQGDRAAAARWVDAALSAQAAREREGAGVGAHREQWIPPALLPCLLVGLGRTEEALALLDPLIHEAESAGYTGNLIAARAARALALHAMGEEGEALAALGRALALAEPEGYVRTFADMGAPMADLLARLAAAPGALPVGRAYLAALIDACGAAGAPPSSPPGAPRAESLSEREREVLRLMAGGAANREIAGALVVSIHTVKTHVAHILAKLHAANRTQAVARARELRLV